MSSLFVEARFASVLSIVSVISVLNWYAPAIAPGMLTDSVTFLLEIAHVPSPVAFVLPPTLHASFGTLALSVDVMYALFAITAAMFAAATPSDTCAIEPTTIFTVGWPFWSTSCVLPYTTSAAAMPAPARRATPASAAIFFTFTPFMYSPHVFSVWCLVAAFKGHSFHKDYQRQVFVPFIYSIPCTLFPRALIECLS